MDDAFNRAVGRHEPVDIDTEASGQRRSDLLFVQALAFDRRRFDDIIGQRAQECRLACAKSQGFNAANEPPLIEAYLC